MLNEDTIRQIVREETMKAIVRIYVEPDEGESTEDTELGVVGRLTFPKELD